MLQLLPGGFLTYLLLLLDSCHAHQFNIQPSRLHSHRHIRRQGISLNNSRDISYRAEIFLGGQPFQVLVDTGSSDLWVAGSVQQSNDTGLNASIFYAIGNVEGPIRIAPLRLGDHLVENQAFIQAPPSATNPEGTGVLGLGPSSGSFVLQALPNVTGAPPLDRLFIQNSSTPNYFTIFLDRDSGDSSLTSHHLCNPERSTSVDSASSIDGSITIGSVLPNYSAILSSPKLPISLVSESDSHDQHFQVQLDPDGIIGPDRNPIQLDSAFENEDNGHATAVMDCGFSLPQVPHAVAEAIYGRFEDAEFAAVEGVGGVWVMPCEIEVNVTFVFGGNEFPMHPLDMTLEPEIFNLDNITSSSGAPVCIGSFQPFTFDRGRQPTYDFVLGMAFMRNVYTLFDYGDFVFDPNTTDNDSDPYIQMYSITNASQAHLDFVNVRLGGIDTTGDQHLLDPPRKNGNDGKTQPVPYIVAAVVAAVVAVAAVAFIIWHRRSRRRIAGREN